MKHTGFKNGGAASADQLNSVQDVTDKIIALLTEKFDHLQSPLDSIMENNTPHIIEAEGRLSETEDKMLNLENKVALLETTVKTFVE